MRKLNFGLCIASLAILAAPVGAEDGNDSRRVIVTGTRPQLAKDARAAIKCGFEVVTVRPWRNGDALRPQVSGHLVLEVTPPSRASDQELTRIFGCFYHARGYDKFVIL
ncbi:MAG: hypothetical protein ABIQ32_02790 [Sphingomicrobium sp.]